MPELSANWGLSLSRIYQIARKYGGRLSAQEVHYRRGRLSAANLRESLRKRREAGLPLGRSRIFPDDPAKREAYLDLSAAMGSAYAREAMGL